MDINDFEWKLEKEDSSDSMEYILTAKQEESETVIKVDKVLKYDIVIVGGGVSGSKQLLVQQQ